MRRCVVLFPSRQLDAGGFKQACGSMVYRRAAPAGVPPPPGVRRVDGRCGLVCSPLAVLALEIVGLWDSEL